jgi:hypothetical protein
VLLRPEEVEERLADLRAGHHVLAKSNQCSVFSSQWACRRLRGQRGNPMEHTEA